jgi:hypothetical protein
MAVCIKKSPVTSSNMKNASVLMKLGTNIDCTIASVTACSIFNFLLPWQRGGRLKIAKIHYFTLFFSNKTDSKVLQLLNG